MLQQVVVAPGKLEFREVSNPKINQDQVLVRIKRIGICGSDLRVYEGSYPGVEYPITQGREASGEIVEVGSAVLNLFPGQKVTIQPQLPCGECRYCREGKYNLCENLRVMGFQTPGMASEYFAVDADKVATLPKDSSYEAGTMVEPLAVAVHAVKRAGNVKHKNVLILGAGPIGVITAQAAKGMGAGSVMITDLMDPRLGLAEKCGLHRTYINAIECQRRSISLNNIQVIADALEIDTYLLLIDNTADNDNSGAGAQSKGDVAE